MTTTYPSLLAAIDAAQGEALALAHIPQLGWVVYDPLEFIADGATEFVVSETGEIWPLVELGPEFSAGGEAGGEIDRQICAKALAQLLATSNSAFNRERFIEAIRSPK